MVIFVGFDEGGQDGFLDVEAVFGLVEDDGLRAVQYFLGDFLAGVGGQALAQSGRAQAIAGGTMPSGCGTVASGTHVAAISRLPSVTGPGKMQRPSPGPRSRPQTKQELYCSSAR